jgi:Do/DeqQ family serine protease
MKRYTPFVITGLLSACFALGLFALLDKPAFSDNLSAPKMVLTNYSPMEMNMASALPTGTPDLVKASNTSKMAVVYIESSTSSPSTYFSRRAAQTSTGSGVIISENGYIATNHHVIEDGNDIAVLMEDGREFEAKLIGSDASTDLALLKVEAKGLPHLSFGDSDSLQVGEWVIAIGNPFRLYSTVTAGIVSAKSRNINILEESGIEAFIQTDAAVNPGNSGGALVNTRGQLMGINTAIMTYSGQYEGFSFAVPSNLVKKVLKDIREYGSIRRGWLGVAIRPVDAATAKDAGLSEISGVIIESVNVSSAAEEAGLKEGDVVVSIDGQKIMTSPDFMSRIGQHRPGDVLSFQYIRDGKRKETLVKLSDSRTATLGNSLATNANPDDILIGIGLDVRDLNSVEKMRLPREGVIVHDIKPGSQIALANMEEKFIITKINGESVKSTEDLKAALKHAGTGLYLQGYYEDYPGDYAYKLALK